MLVASLLIKLIYISVVPFLVRVGPDSVEGIIGFISSPRLITNLVCLKIILRTFESITQYAIESILVIISYLW
jgi:hypothetical protein